jgi:hypothetical protein
MIKKTPSTDVTEPVPVQGLRPDTAGREKPSSFLNHQIKKTD